jgi:Family of unknown function (DUF6492)
VTDLAVVTPTYRPDAPLFADLHRSVLEFTPPGTVHHVIVPPRDRALFARYEGPRCRIVPTSDLLPRRYLSVPGANAHVNLRRPWPPVRGWVMQQAVKLAAVSQLDAEVVLLADSDVVLVRAVRRDRFMIDGQPSLFRDEKGVTEDMDRHVVWHRVAREILDLPPAPPPPLPDYINPLNVWRPAVVRELLERIRASTGRDWLDVFNARLHISEFILYGVFVDEVLAASGPRPPGEATISHNSWERAPLDRDAALTLAEGLPRDAVALMISAKSHTPLDVRRVAIERCAEIVRSE